jgi:hypothetical protein
MPRATEKYLREQVIDLQMQGHNVTLKFQGGCVKLVEPIGKGGHRDITHPLTNGQMALWLDAYRRGFEASKQKHQGALDALKAMVVLWHDGHDTIDGKPTFDICGRATCMKIAHILRGLGVL